MQIHLSPATSANNAFVSVLFNTVCWIRRIAINVRNLFVIYFTINLYLHIHFLFVFFYLNLEILTYFFTLTYSPTN